MRVKYVHASDPNKVKVYDIEEAYKKCPFLDPLNRPTLDDWTRRELDYFASDKKKGIILTYEICE